MSNSIAMSTVVWYLLQQGFTKGQPVKWLLVHSFLIYELICHIFNAQQTLYKVNISAKFHCSRSSCSSSILHSTDGQTDKRTDGHIQIDLESQQDQEKICPIFNTKKPCVRLLFVFFCSSFILLSTEGQTDGYIQIDLESHQNLEYITIHVKVLDKYFGTLQTE